MHLRRALLAVLLLIPSIALSARGDAAEKAYQAARRSYYTLKDDAARRKMRHHWLAAAGRFEDVAKHHPKSGRAPDALFTAAELLNELSQISRLDEDLKGAMDNYRKVAEGYASHPLMDDSALALARIYSDRIGNPEAARRVLERAAVHGKGDRGNELAALARSLAPGEPALHFGPPETKVAKEKSAPAAVAAKGASRAKAESHPTSSGTAKAETDAKASPVAETPVAVASRPVAEPPRASADATPKPAPGIEPGSADAASSEQPREVEVATAAPTPESALAQSRGNVDRDALARAFDRAARGSTSSPAASAPAVAPPAATRPALALRSSSGDEGASREATSAPVRSVPTRKEAQQLARSLPSSAEVTLAEQLGLKVRRVVIDPGHGGHDSGALGKKGVMEKDIALEVSTRVAEKLRAEGLEVLLTRTDDRFVRLEDRARFANESRGDLFISIHCNSAPNKKLRGIETYTLNTSADRYSIRLAARENASSEKGISDLQFILADLATKANTEESSRLATRVQKSLVGQMGAKYSGIKDLGTKEALFYVLLGVRMPAILVETSFLSHAEEGPRLATDAYQKDLAASISQGVLEFLEHRSRLAQVQ